VRILGPPLRASGLVLILGRSRFVLVERVGGAPLRRPVLIPATSARRNPVLILGAAVSGGGSGAYPGPSTALLGKPCEEDIHAVAGAYPGSPGAAHPVLILGRPYWAGGPVLILEPLSYSLVVRPVLILGWPVLILA